VTVLSYQSIRRRLMMRHWQRICVTKRFPGMIQPASLDVQLGDAMWIWSDSEREWLAMGLTGAGCWHLDPDRFYLGVLRQFIRVPRDLLGKLEGKSSRGRDGILVHRAGVFDPGWGGNATLEIDVRRKREPLWPGMPIAQVVFEVLDEPTQMPYGSPELGSHYQGDLGISSSRLTDKPEIPTVPSGLARLGANRTGQSSAARLLGGSLQTPSS
jgi:dCTP deaminase